MAAAADDAGPAVIGYVVRRQLSWTSALGELLLTTASPCKRSGATQGDPDTFAEAVAVELGRRLVGAAAEVQPFGMVGQLAAAVAAGRATGPPLAEFLSRCRLTANTLLLCPIS